MMEEFIKATGMTPKEVRFMRGETCPSMILTPPMSVNEHLEHSPDDMIKLLVRMDEDHRNFMLVLIAFELCFALEHEESPAKFNEFLQVMEGSMECLSRLTRTLNAYDVLLKVGVDKGLTVFTPEEALQIVLRDFAKDYKEKFKGSGNGDS